MTSHDIALTAPLLRITSDVWSMALTVLEVALNRFPFPLPGEAPIKGVFELLTYWTAMENPMRVLEVEAPTEEGGAGFKYTKSFREFIRARCVLSPFARGRGADAVARQLGTQPATAPPAADASLAGSVDSQVDRAARPGRPRQMGRGGAGWSLKRPSNPPARPFVDSPEVVAFKYPHPIPRLPPCKTRIRSSAWCAPRNDARVLM